MPVLTQAQRDVLELEEIGDLFSLKDDPKSRYYCDTLWSATKKRVELLQISLAKSRIKSEARRKMLVRHEWGAYDDVEDDYCLECKNYKSDGHKPDCALDALAKEG